MEKDLPGKLLAELKTAAEPVKQQAIANVSPFSSKAAKAIRIASRGGRARPAVYIASGGKRAPVGMPMENWGKAGTWRHPVFAVGATRGTWTGAWVEQTAHPHLYPALVSTADQVAENVGDVLVRFFEEHGWKG